MVRFLLREKKNRRFDCFVPKPELTYKLRNLSVQLKKL